MNATPPAHDVAAAPAVGYVVRMFPQTSETFIANEVLALERLGVRVHIYSYRHPSEVVPHRYLSEIEAPITYLPEPLNRHVDQLVRAGLRFARAEPAAYRRVAAYVARHTLRERNLDTWRRFLQAGYLADLLRNSNVQHLHAHFAHGSTRVAMLAGMLTGIPYSFTAHARDVFNQGVDYRLLREKIERARFVVTVSDYNKRFLAERLGVEMNGHVRVLHNGVDLDRFRPGDDGLRDTQLVLAVGRHVEKKGYAHLVEALRILRDEGRAFSCRFVGQGELRASLERDVAANGLGERVTFSGSLPQEDLPDLYRRAAMFVLPAVQAADGDRDALPTVLLEAMACGVPVIASRLSGIPEIIDDEENGLLVEPADAPALARTIDRLLTDRALRARLGVAARRKVERAFDLQRSAQELRHLFSESVAARS